MPDDRVSQRTSRPGPTKQSPAPPSLAGLVRECDDSNCQAVGYALGCCSLCGRFQNFGDELRAAHAGLLALAVDFDAMVGECMRRDMKHGAAAFRTAAAQLRERLGVLDQ